MNLGEAMWFVLLSREPANNKTTISVAARVGAEWPTESSLEPRHEQIEVAIVLSKSVSDLYKGQLFDTANWSYFLCYISILCYIFNPQLAYNPPKHPL